MCLKQKYEATALATATVGTTTTAQVIGAKAQAATTLIQGKKIHAASFEIIMAACFQSDMHF
jgi:hypothetical protein